MSGSMWKNKVDTSKLKEDVGIDYKVGSQRYIKTKVRKCKDIFSKNYCLDNTKKKNRKLYIFLMLDNKENINLMQQFEIKYLKNKVRDIEGSLKVMESGVPHTIIERQMNVKIEFINWIIDNGLMEYINNFTQKEEKYRGKIKKGYRVVETDRLIDEYMENKLDIIGYVRDGFTVTHALDEVGSIYNTREWMTFMDIISEEGYDLRGSDKIEDVILMKLEGYSNEDIEVEMGFNGTVEEECQIVFRGMDFGIKIETIGDEVVKEYQELRKDKEFVEKDLGDVVYNISTKEGTDLLEYMDDYLYKHGDFSKILH